MAFWAEEAGTSELVEAGIALKARAPATAASVSALRAMGISPGRFLIRQAACVGPIREFVATTFHHEFFTAYYEAKLCI
jgi:hypothetical protein